MERLKLPYYAGLLSAAQYHGAAHHRPQEFQVFLAKNRRPIHCGTVRVAFMARKRLKDVPVQSFNTPRGTSRSRRRRRRRSTSSATPITRAVSIKSPRFSPNWPSGSIPRNLPAAARTAPVALGATARIPAGASWLRPRRRRRSRSMCASTQGSRPCCCQKRHASAPAATRAGSSTSMPTWRPSCDPARLHHRVANGSAVGAGLPGRARPRHQPRTRRDFLAPAPARCPRVPRRHGALQAPSQTGRPLFGRHRSRADAGGAGGSDDGSAARRLSIRGSANRNGNRPRDASPSSTGSIPRTRRRSRCG